MQTNAKTSRVNSKILTSFKLDAAFYQHEYLELEGKFYKSKIPLSKLENIRLNKNGYKYGTNDPIQEAVGKYRVLSIPNIDDCLISDQPEKFCVESQNEHKVSTGDVLLVRSNGNRNLTGRCGLVTERFADFAYASFLIRIRLNPQLVDPGFFTAFMNCSHGKIQRKRFANGTNLFNVNMEELDYFVIPKPDKPAQTYIGDKVRWAEQLRERARELENFVQNFLDGVVPEYEHNPSKISRVSVKTLSNRLDLQHYRTHYLAQEKAIRSVPYNFLGDITTISSGDAVPTTEFKNEGIPLVRIRNISSKGFVDQDIFVSYEYAFNKNAYSAKPGNIVVGMDGEFRSQFFLSEELPQFINQRIAIVNITKIRPELLTVWLNRSEGQYQLYRWSVKTTVEHISLSDIANVMVPRLSLSVENDLADEILSSRNCMLMSQNLTTAAKLLVEALIEGKITEAELINAQEALEKGDIDLDWKIMSRLTRKGIDVKDEPSMFLSAYLLYDAVGKWDIAKGEDA